MYLNGDFTNLGFSNCDIEPASTEATRKNMLTEQRSF